MTPIFFWKDCKQIKIGTNNDFCALIDQNKPNNTLINGSLNFLLFVDLAADLKFWYQLVVGQSKNV